MKGRNSGENETYWNRRSEIFDTQIFKIYEDAYRKTIDNTKKYLICTDRVLDIGCGTGVTTIELAGSVSEMTAVDTSPEMLRLAREKAEKKKAEKKKAEKEKAEKKKAEKEKAKKENAENEKAENGKAANINFMLGDMFLEDLGQGCFDAITIFNVLLYLPDKGAAMRRLRELLKPGGYLMVASDCLKYSFTREALRKWYRSHTGTMPFVEFYTPESLERLIQNSGFEIVERERLFLHPVNYFLVGRKKTGI